MSSESIRRVPLAETVWLFERFDDSTHFLVYCAPDSKSSNTDGHHADPQRNRNLSGTEFLELEQVVSLIVLHPHLLLRQLSRLGEDRLFQFSINEAAQVHFVQIWDAVCGGPGGIVRSRMARPPVQRIALLSSILVGNAGLNDSSKPGPKPSAAFIRHKVVDVISDGDHRLLDDIFRLFMGQTSPSPRRIDEILVQFVELTPAVLVASANLGEERRSRL